MNSLKALKVVAVRSRAGKVPNLPSRDNINSHPRMGMDNDKFRPFHCILDGLQVDAKVPGAIFVGGSLCCLLESPVDTR